jgi:hypothetical protein
MTNTAGQSIPENHKATKFRFSFDPDEVAMLEQHYANGRLRIQFVTVPDSAGFSEPFATLTTNLPNLELQEGEFFVKTWSENAPLIEPLLKSGVFEIVANHPSGEVVWRFAP